MRRRKRRKTRRRRKRKKRRRRRKRVRRKKRDKGHPTAPQKDPTPSTFVVQQRTIGEWGGRPLWARGRYGLPHFR